MLQVAQGVKTSVAKLKAILKLARSPALQLLQIDRTLEPALDALIQNGIPPSMHTLTLDFRGPSTREHGKPFEALFKMLNVAEHVRDLRLTDMGKMENLHEYPRQFRLSPCAVPSLQSLSSPLSYLSLFSKGRPIKRLTFVDILVNHPPVVKHTTVEDVAETLQTFGGLDAIQFNLRDWDKEVFYMLSGKLNRAREIRITYRNGGPDDVSSLFVTKGLGLTRVCRHSS